MMGSVAQPNSGQKAAAVVWVGVRVGGVGWGGGGVGGGAGVRAGGLQVGRAHGRMWAAYEQQPVPSARPQLTHRQKMRKTSRQSPQYEPSSPTGRKVRKVSRKRWVWRE